MLGIFLTSQIYFWFIEKQKYTFGSFEAIFCFIRRFFFFFKRVQGERKKQKKKRGGGEGVEDESIMLLMFY